MPSPIKHTEVRPTSPAKTQVPQKQIEEITITKPAADPKMALMTLQSEEQLNLSNQVSLMNARLQAELEEQKQRVNAQFDQELQSAQAAIEQARAQALFILEQQIAQRKAEMERRLQHEMRMMEIKAAQASFGPGSSPFGLPGASMTPFYIRGPAQPQVYTAIPQGIQFVQSTFAHPLGLPTLYSQSFGIPVNQPVLSPRGPLGPSQQAGAATLNRPVI